MEKELKEFLLGFKLKESEIENLTNLAPMLDYTSLQEFKQNACVLIEFGYPKEDLIELLMINPNIFASDAQALQKELALLKHKFGDIEDALKNNPFCI